jgi:hypothetical protein
MSRSHNGVGDKRTTIRRKAVMILKIDICMGYGRGTGGRGHFFSDDLIPLSQ